MSLRNSFEVNTHVESLVTSMDEDVTGGGVEDKTIGIPWTDMNTVLKDWKDIMKEYKKIGVEIFQHFLNEHPSYKNYFSSLVTVSPDDLIKNKDFILHSYAVLKGIDSTMKALSGEFEEEIQLLPLMGLLHFKRGITKTIMNHFKESLVFVCCHYLKSNKRETASWVTVMDYIFKEYLYKDMPEREIKTEKKKSKSRKIET